MKNERQNSARKIGLALLCLLVHQEVWAQAPGNTQVTRSIQVLPVPPFDLVDDVVFGGSVRPTPPGTDPNLRVHLVVGCYGRNLRSVKNPITPEAEIKMGLGLGAAPGLPVEVTFPGWLVKDGDGFGNEPPALMGAFNAAAEFDINPTFGLPFVPITFNPPPNNVASAAAYGNVVQIQTTIPIATIVSFNAQGGYSPSAKNNTIAYLNFIQNLAKTSDPANNCMNEDKDKNWRESVSSWIGNNLFPKAQAGGDGSFPAGQDGGGDGGVANYKNWGKTYVTNPNLQWVPPPAVPGGNAATAKCENRVRIPRPAVKRPTKDANKYIGMDGPVNFQYLHHWASNFSSLELFVSFPGEDKFCGGFFSPLMLFTDNRRPTFTGKSNMMNRPDPGFSAWVEPNAPGTFLALDRNQNNKIDDATELFGEDELAPNGFEKLRQYDENQDGVIDARDPVFKKLLFFTDNNGNGRNDAGEVTLATYGGLIAISLKYQSTDVRQYARGLASSREHSRFKFRDRATGKVRTGEVIDVWFARK